MWHPFFQWTMSKMTEFWSDYVGIFWSKGEIIHRKIDHCSAKNLDLIEQRFQIEQIIGNNWTNEEVQWFNMIISEEDSYWGWKGERETEENFTCKSKMNIDFEAERDFQWIQSDELSLFVLFPCLFDLHDQYSSHIRIKWERERDDPFH